MSEKRKVRKFSSDMRDHLFSKDFGAVGYSVSHASGNRWGVYNRKTGVRIITFDKKKDAERWVAENDPRKLKRLDSNAQIIS